MFENAASFRELFERLHVLQWMLPKILAIFNPGSQLISRLGELATYVPILLPSAFPNYSTIAKSEG